MEKSASFHSRSATKCLPPAQQILILITDPGALQRLTTMIFMSLEKGSLVSVLIPAHQTYCLLQNQTFQMKIRHGVPGHLALQLVVVDLRLEKTLCALEELLGVLVNNLENVISQHVQQHHPHPPLHPHNGLSGRLVVSHAAVEHK